MRKYSKYPKGGKKKGYVKKSYPKKSYSKVNSLDTKIKTIVENTLIKNQEKKRFHTYASDQLVGQLRVSGTNFVSGHYVADVTPTPDNGTGIGEKIGNKIRLLSSRFHFQFRQQTNTFGGPIKGHIYIIQPKAGLQDAVQIPEEFINPNPWLASQSFLVYDDISNRNFDTMSNYIVHRKIPFKVDPDSSGSGAMVMVKTFNFGIKYNYGKGLGMSLNADIPLTDELKMLVVVDSGNQSTSVGSVIPTGIVTAQATTGLIFSWFVDHWFTDS